jgi:hypothetical protein
MFWASAAEDGPKDRPENTFLEMVKKLKSERTE